MVEEIMCKKINKKMFGKKILTLFVILLLAIQIIAVFSVDTSFADETNNPDIRTEGDIDNISYSVSYTLGVHGTQEYIESWKAHNPDLVNPDPNDPLMDQPAVIIPWYGGIPGQFVLSTQTIRYRVEENGREVFKTRRRRVIRLSMKVVAGVSVTIPTYEQPTAKVTRYIDEDGNTVKEAGTFGFLDADQYIYDAGGKIAYVFKNTLPDTSDIRTHVYTKYVEPVPTTPQVQETPKPKVSESRVPSRPGISKVKKASSRIAPKTADNTGIAFYSGLLGLSVASVMLIMMKKKFTLSK